MNAAELYRRRQLRRLAVQDGACRSMAPERNFEPVVLSTSEARSLGISEMVQGRVTAQSNSVIRGYPAYMQRMEARQAAEYQYLIDRALDQERGRARPHSRSRSRSRSYSDEQASYHRSQSGGRIPSYDGVETYSHHAVGEAGLSSRGRLRSHSRASEEFSTQLHSQHLSYPRPANPYGSLYEPDVRTPTRDDIPIDHPTIATRIPETSRRLTYEPYISSEQRLNRSLQPPPPRTYRPTGFPGDSDTADTAWLHPDMAEMARRYAAHEAYVRRRYRREY